MAWDEIYRRLFRTIWRSCRWALRCFSWKKKKKKPSSIIKKEAQLHGDLSVRELDQAEAITQPEFFESTVVTLVGCIFGIGMKFTEGI